MTKHLFAASSDPTSLLPCCNVILHKKIFNGLQPTSDVHLRMAQFCSWCPQGTPLASLTTLDNLWPGRGWRKLGKETTLGLFRQQKPGRESQHAMAKGKGECQQRPPQYDPNTANTWQHTSTPATAAAAAAATATTTITVISSGSGSKQKLPSSSRSSSRSS